MPPATYLELQSQLIAMAKADQDMRTDFIESGGAWDDSLDRKHTAQLREIIALYGWPTIPTVGAEASNAAWLIAQHADHNVEFQKECLVLLKAARPGEVSRHNIAYLEDRTLVAESKLQLYGTQFQGQGATLQPCPIADEVYVDERRKRMGLGTLAEYKALMLEAYGDSGG